MSLDRLWRMLSEYHAQLLSGLAVTFELSVVSMAIGLVLGLLVCFGSLARLRAVRLPSILFIEFCRDTPILVQLVWVHFAWPAIIGINFSAWTSAVIALAMQSSGYLAEEFRAGIESIERGQIEAAQSLGMTSARLMWRIVVPQALIKMMPGILNQFVTCFKSTSIVSIIAVQDLMYQAGLIASATFLPMPIYTLVALTYFVMVLAVSSAVRLITRRLPNFGYFHERTVAA
ncbi:MAG: amino acid ABC transporter permease [Burkholderiales bacterium]